MLIDFKKHTFALSESAERRHHDFIKPYTSPNGLPHPSSRFFCNVWDRIHNQEKLSMARKFNFRQKFAFFSLPLILMMISFACIKPIIEFQNVYNGDNATNVVMVDTFSVQMSTVFLDSFVSSGTPVQLIGRYIDPYFGVITSQGYSDYGPPRPLPTLTNFSVYDSLQLITRIDRTFYGDTTPVQRFEVSQLTQVMNPPGQQVAFFNNQSVPYNPTVLGYADVQIYPHRGLTSQRAGDTIKISLPNSMGQELFGLLYRQPDTIKSDNAFRNYFKGLTVYSDTTRPGAIYGFKDSMFIRLYYHDPGTTITEKFADFPVINGRLQFNQITANRSGTPTEPLGQSYTELASTASGNQAYMQPITSLYVKLLFPTISNIYGYPDYLALMKAELVVKVVQGTYSPLFNLPPAVNLALTGPANTIGGILSSSGSGNLTVDYLYGTNTGYSYDITAYIQNALTQGAPANQKDGLIMIAPAATYNTQFNRGVFGNTYNSQNSNQISLKLYYASFY